jgi:hypothetical protein
MPTTVSILKIKDGRVIDTILFDSPVKNASIDYHGKSINITPLGIRVINSGINDNTLYIMFTNTRPASIYIDDDYNYDITIHFPNLVVVMFVNDGVLNIGATTP